MEETMVMNAAEETTAIVPQQEAIPDTTGVDATTTEKSGKGKTAALIGGGVAAVAAMGGIAFGLVKHFRKKKAVTVEDPEPETNQKTLTASELDDMSNEEFTAWVELFKAEADRRAALDKISEQPEKATEEKTDDEPDNPEKTDDEPEQNNQEDQQQENTEPATKPDNKKKKGR